jgi:DNA-binding transcriptional regulator YhcF (GntR family)
VTDRPTLTVDTDDPTPPYEQLRRQLADLIEYGVLATDDRLPPLRQLAADLGLAVGTVARTYRELELAGLVVSRRGGGTRVAAAQARSPAAVLHERAAAFVRDARLLGADDEQIRSAVAAALGP